MDENSIILSIKPQHANKIFSGEKKFEFRKRIWTDPYTRKVYVYSSAPIKMIIGHFYINHVFTDHPSGLWDFFDFEREAAISKEEFFEYFGEGITAHAIEITKPLKFQVPINPKEFDPEFRAPQNFMYIDGVNEDLQAKLIKTSMIEKFQEQIARLQAIVEKRGGLFR